MKIVGKIPPSHWRRYAGNAGEAATSWQHRLTSMLVLRSISRTRFGDQYIHVSASLPDRELSWGEITKIKNEFLGENVAAYHVIARKADHVNIHSFCFHLWQPIGESKQVANLQDLIHEAAL